MGVNLLSPLEGDSSLIVVHHLKQGPPNAAQHPAGGAGVSQWTRPEGGSFTAPFVPSAAFTGPQAGYHFTMGPKGLGYYREDQAQSVPSAGSLLQGPGSRA